MPRVGRLVLTMLFAACAGTGPATGKLVVSLKVSGVDIGTIYTVTVDEMPPKSIPMDGTREFDLPVADYLVRLHWAADNCVPSPTGVQSVSIRDGETSYLGYLVNCTANSGFVSLQTTTTGRDTDPDGYIAYTSHPDALVYNGTWVGTNGQVVLGPVAVGEHDLLLDDLAANCAVTGKNPLRITVPKGQLVRDTVSVSMEITCTAKAP